jgi:hypothetical protein
MNSRAKRVISQAGIRIAVSFIRLSSSITRMIAPLRHGVPVSPVDQVHLSPALRSVKLAGKPALMASRACHAPRIRVGAVEAGRGFYRLVSVTKAGNEAGPRT